MKAVWNGVTIAQSDDIVRVEGNSYFPRQSLNDAYLKESGTNTVCPWKGTASYYTLVVDGKENRDAVWYYSEPKDAARSVRDRVAFWRGVEIVPD